MLNRKTIVLTQTGAYGMLCCHEQVVPPMVDEPAFEPCDKSARKNRPGAERKNCLQRRYTFCQRHLAQMPPRPKGKRLSTFTPRPNECGSRFNVFPALKDGDFLSSGKPERSGPIQMRFAFLPGDSLPGRWPGSGLENVDSRVMVGVHRQAARATFVNRLAFAVRLVVNSTARACRAAANDTKAPTFHLPDAIASRPIMAP